MAYIPPENLVNIAKHKYNSTGYSQLDLILNRMLWEPLVSTFPRNLAPNLITMIGFMFMLGSYLIMLPYDTTFIQKIPSTVLVFSAFFQFLYQTLDACDGKQARRIGLSSPLGMLMDHGCDSISSTVIMMSLFQSLRLGLNTYTYTMLMLVNSAFYLAMWEEYHTHYSRTHILNWGVTEGQLTIVATMLVVAAYQDQILELELFGYYVKHMALNLNMALGLTASVLIFFNTMTKVKGIQPYLRLIPLILMNISLYMWFKSSFIKEYGPLILLTHGCLFGGICSKIIICSTAIMKFGWMHLEVFIELLFLIEDHYLKVLPSEVTLFILCLFILGNYFVFVLGVINQLAGYLKVSVFGVNR